MKISKKMKLFFSKLRLLNEKKEEYKNTYDARTKKTKNLQKEIQDLQNEVDNSLNID